MSLEFHALLGGSPLPWKNIATTTVIYLKLPNCRDVVTLDDAWHEEVGLWV